MVQLLDEFQGPYNSRSMALGHIEKWPKVSPGSGPFIYTACRDSKEQNELENDIPLLKAESSHQC
jgi:hypothetical protein